MAVDEIILLNVDSYVYKGNEIIRSVRVRKHALASSLTGSLRIQAPIMIASVVAVLESGHARAEVLEALAKVPNIEIGDATLNPWRVPITIDSPTPGDLEVTTRRLQQCPGVAFVDVVFVHFEDIATNQTDPSVPRANEA